MTGFKLFAPAMLALAFPVSAQTADVPRDSAVPPQAIPNYAEIVDLALKSPLVVDGTIRSAVEIDGPEAAGLAPNHARFYVRLDVLALIRGQAALAPQVGYLVDVPLNENGRTPKLKGLRVLAFARPVAGRPGQLQLAARDGQQPWSPALDSTTRDIVQALVSGDTPPAILGIGNAFHVPGSLPGESETQIFLETESGAPISLSILSRPNQPKRWAVALSDIVGEAAEPPEHDTLLWYRLACGLPPRLPASSVADQSTDNAQAAREDYRFVLQSLGPCRRGDSPR